VVAGDDPVKILEKVIDRVVSMHASDRYLVPGATLDELQHAEGSAGYSKILMHGVTGKGLNDYDAIFQLLRGVGYAGWISIEDGMNGMEEMEESLQFLHRKVQQYYE
jgi:sugar phosphate isomerase/epimerase